MVSLPSQVPPYRGTGERFGTVARTGLSLFLDPHLEQRIAEDGDVDFGRPHSSLLGSVSRLLLVSIATQSLPSRDYPEPTPPLAL